MEITEGAKMRAIRALELSLTCQDTAEEVVQAIIDALNYEPSEEVRHAAAALRRWNIGNSIHTEADFEEIAEVVLAAAKTVESGQQPTDQATDLLARALPGVRQLLEWFGGREDNGVTRKAAAHARIWAQKLQRLQVLHGFDSDMEWLPHHTKLLSELVVKK